MQLHEGDSVEFSVTFDRDGFMAQNAGWWFGYIYRDVSNVTVTPDTNQYQIHFDYDFPFEPGNDPQFSVELVSVDGDKLNFKATYLNDYQLGTFTNTMNVSFHVEWSSDNYMQFSDGLHYVDTDTHSMDYDNFIDFDLVDNDVWGTAELDKAKAAHLRQFSELNEMANLNFSVAQLARTMHADLDQAQNEARMAAIWTFVDIGTISFGKFLKAFVRNGELVQKFVSYGVDITHLVSDGMSKDDIAGALNILSSASADTYEAIKNSLALDDLKGRKFVKFIGDKLEWLPLVGLAMDVKETYGKTHDFKVLNNFFQKEMMPKLQAMTENLSDVWQEGTDVQWFFNYYNKGVITGAHIPGSYGAKGAEAAAGSGASFDSLAGYNMPNGLGPVMLSVKTSIYSDAANSITLGTGNREAHGRGGADTIVGNTGNDVIYGEDGNDSLTGGKGYDLLSGGNGNDTYVVDRDDFVDERLVSGTDTIKANFHFSLADTWRSRGSIENLVLTGSAAIHGYGNELNNKVTGNSGTNTLTGAGGKDTLAGGGGNDTLTGGIGADSLTGGAGGDTFHFDAKDGGLTTATVDVITDWSTADAIDTKIVGKSSNYYEAKVSAAVDTIEEALAFAKSKVTNKAIAHVFLYNSSADIGFVLMDLNNDDKFETGVVLSRSGSASDFSFADLV